MYRDFALRSWPLRAAGCVLLAVLAGCAGAPVAPATSAAMAAGAARIWFYRDYEPSVSLNIANVGLNGVTAASVDAFGSALYRDVPPGRYHVTVESFGTDVNQAKDVDLMPGQEAFVKVLAAGGWESDGERNSFKRDTFYVSLVPPQVARAELATHPLSGG